MRNSSKLASSGAGAQAQQQPPRADPQEAKMMRTLEAAVAKLGGQLPAG